MRVVTLIITAQKSLLKPCGSCCNDGRHASVTAKMLVEAGGMGWLWHCPSQSNSLLGKLCWKQFINIASQPTLPVLFVFLCRHSLLLFPCPGSNTHYSLTSFQSLWLTSSMQAPLALRKLAPIPLTGLDKGTGSSSAPFFIWPWADVLPLL